MHILIGLLLGCALLYFWLIGQWFARVLVFLGLGVLGAFLLANAGPDRGAQLGAFVPAWMIASIPIWWHRRNDD